MPPVQPRRSLLQFRGSGSVFQSIASMEGWFALRPCLAGGPQVPPCLVWSLIPSLPSAAGQAGRTRAIRILSRSRSHAARSPRPIAEDPHRRPWAGYGNRLAAGGEEGDRWQAGI